MLVLAEPVAAVEHGVVGARPGPAERVHGVQGAAVLLLAGRPQLGWQLGREQVHLGIEAEPALSVVDDFLDGRAMPGGFLNGGDVDPLPCSR